MIRSGYMVMLVSALVVGNRVIRWSKKVMLRGHKLYHY